jgi:hypothetical protein
MVANSVVSVPAVTDKSHHDKPRGTAMVANSIVSVPAVTDKSHHDETANSRGVGATIRDLWSLYQLGETIDTKGITTNGIKTKLRRFRASVYSLPACFCVLSTSRKNEEKNSY